MVAETSPAIDRAQYLQREDLLGETLRLASAWRKAATPCTMWQPRR